MIFYAHVDRIERDKEDNIKTVNYELWQIEADSEEDCHNIISEHDGLLSGYLRIDKVIWKTGWKETDELVEEPLEVGLKYTLPNDKGEKDGI